MTGRIAGKVAIITGGASGIGRGAVLRFLEEGASVLVADIQDALAARVLEIARERGFGNAVSYLHTDVTVESDIERMIAVAQERFGRLDCVFSNAGAGSAPEPVTEMLAASWDATMALSLRSVFFGIKHGARALKRQGEGGTLIATASVAGQSGGMAPTAYSTAKAGVIQLTRLAAVELAPYRIRVNSISPGAILNPGFEAGGITAARLAAVQPLPQAGQPLDVANVAVFLASDDSGFVTGSDYVVDGGLVALGPQVLQRLYGF
jgi:NAD(P)-dependent dehydrogenase (short-subunit alcohol dehydrogenase family)